MVSSRERSFIEQNVSYHASGGDLDALVYVADVADGGVRFLEDAAGGATRLHLAAIRGYCSAMVFLLENGADVHLGWPSQYGLTPLHDAASRNRCDPVALLIDAGARADDCDARGFTALHYAAAHNHPKICKLLLSRGASLDPRNIYGRDPEASARYCSHTATADFLAAVRAAGGWLPWLEAPRKELLALRQRLPALRDRGRAAPSSSVRAHERLFLDTPDDVFTSILAFWRSERDD
jgi:hypothetical protein